MQFSHALSSLVILPHAGAVSLPVAVLQEAMPEARAVVGESAEGRVLVLTSMLAQAEVALTPSRLVFTDHSRVRPLGKQFVPIVAAVMKVVTEVKEPFKPRAAGINVEYRSDDCGSTARAAIQKAFPETIDISDLGAITGRSVDLLFEKNGFRVNAVIGPVNEEAEARLISVKVNMHAADAEKIGFSDSDVLSKHFEMAHNLVETLAARIVGAL